MSDVRPARWSRAQIAELIAHDIPEGWYVNLGIGIPTLVSNYLDEKEVVLQSENGILGFGRQADENDRSLWLQNAGKQYVTLRNGASLFHHADSFSQIRGGHLDLCVLGAYQVDVRGDLANWMTNNPDAIPAVGGAMDLAAGAQRIWVCMEHTTRDGAPRLVENCTYPLTARNVVERIYTDMGIFEVHEGSFKLRQLAPGVDLAMVAAATAAPLAQ